MYQGTYKPNRRPVVTTAPDCLVYINGELSLPSGANPNRRVPLQPLINTISVNLGVNSVPGSASIDLHIPAHYLGDIYVGGQLTLTTMMEVQIYAKGHFSVGGSPRYYPIFWGVVTSLQESYSAGEQTVSLSCSDILYWWQVSQININPSYLATLKDQTQQVNLRGHTFTGMNAFDIIYSLSRYVYGDSMNVRNQSVPNREARTEPISGADTKRMMAYWSAKWGRITQNIKMYGPSGNVLQGGQLASVLSGENRDFFLRQRKGSAKATKLKDYEPFKQDFFDVSAIAPFSQKLSQLGAVEIENSEFENKLNLALQTKEAINYEFYMDVTGEIIFKPPFFNMDTRLNFPVSWIRDVDVISWNFSENPPEATFVEATGRYTQNVEVGLSSLAQTKATYVDYRLVQKYGWRPGAFSSEFIGSKENGGPKALFYHLVDILDQQNARINSGTVTIPFRPELRLGYPVYVEGKDAYYYVEGISHSFGYGSRCTTSLTLSARRQKFYGAFERWRDEAAEPKPGDLALPGDIPRNIGARPTDPNGRPLGDRNVVMTYLPEKDFKRFGDVVPTFEDDSTDSDRRLRNLVDLRSQFGNTTDNRYVYLIDPNRETPYVSDEANNRSRGPVTHIESDPKLQITATSEGTTETATVNAVVFPVSDERGYEVIGAYEYGRRVLATPQGYRFDQTPLNTAVELLLNLAPDDLGQPGRTTPNAENEISDNLATAYEADLGGKALKLDPNNYGRRLAELAPPNISADPTLAARVLSAQLQFSNAQGASSSVPATAAPSPLSSDSYTVNNKTVRKSSRGRVFKYNSNVARWRPNIRAAREKLGYSEATYPDELVLAIIHTESSGKADARRTQKNGKPSQFVGLVQIGKTNAKEFNKRDGTNTSNVDFMNAPDQSLEHFLRYAEKYKGRHGNDPTKIAILWKAGPGSLTLYNRFLATNPSAAEIAQWQAEYPRQYKPNKKPWNLDGYIGDEETARGIWAESLLPIPDGMVVTPEQPMVTEAAILQGDEANDLEASNRVNTVGLPDVIEDEQDSVNRFAEALDDNAQNGVNTLPEGLTPPRDPGIIDALNRFLLNLYERDVQQGAIRERELRGENRTPPATSPPNPVIGGLDTVNLEPVGRANTGIFGREDIRRRLDAGETLGSVLGTEARTATEDTRLKLDRARRDLSTALGQVAAQDPEVVAVRLEKDEDLSAIGGVSLTQKIERATGLDVVEQTRIARDQDDLQETTTLLDELEFLLDPD